MFYLSVFNGLGGGRLDWISSSAVAWSAALLVLGAAFECSRRLLRRLRHLEETSAAMGDALASILDNEAVLGRRDALAVLRDTLRQAKQLPRPGARMFSAESEGRGERIKDGGEE